ncbi:MAG: polyprenyl synthetase family protein [Chloroflexi bacterium]|nr:polyprenyl synthetase family protein [Chloroflexota bacterium]
MNYQDFAGLLLPPFENTIKQTLLSELGSDYPDLNYMLAYHLGWESQGVDPKTQGKRIRPLLLLLSAIACGNRWEDFLSLAASVELIHNFSLIHDDIEDGSPLRRGRETLWVRWGVPQAINAGDLMFTIAHKAVLGNSRILGEQTTLEASQLLLQTCIRLTQGQFMDMNFEKRNDVTSNEYLVMIQGKTAALFGCCSELGAINVSPSTRSAMRNYGLSLGMAFQIQDDILGLWGKTSQTGKSIESDLVSGKKTFPILYALQNNPAIKGRWDKSTITPSEAKEISSQLMEDGTYSYTKSIVEQYTTRAVQYLKSINIDNDAMTSLIEIAGTLFARNN